MVLEMSRQPLGRFAQRRLGARRYDQELSGPERRVLLDGWSFFKDHMRVGASDSERAYSGPAGRTVRLPRRQSRIDEEGTLFQFEKGIRFGAVQGWRQLAMLECQHSLYQSGYAGSRIKMTYISLNRT